MVKVSTSIYVDLDMYEHMKNNPEIESVSKYLRNSYNKDYMQTKSLAKEYEETDKKQQWRLKEIERLSKQKRSMLEKLPEPARNWLMSKDAQYRYKKYSKRAVYKKFVDDYGLSGKINQRQFDILIKGGVE